ncbi:bifunctional 2-polyprenyl-6-hydroxyphenol methylase/3-demethylubiquinol 3-O-methyltransferase UbiG [[Phormidium] sp. ETS-05]|uniref:class I SAM-dependent methyltransferase n=1 Tax=[Phormidium] sp. ETS-05 TaxID=222819 RepID=UPI001E4242CA|nr:class I SAM-dependent methyltransferase [[Phormidium] sp. ETS-05]
MVFQPSQPTSAISTPGTSASNPVTEPTFIEASILNKFKSLTAASGELVMPCIPAMLQQHIKQIESLLIALDIDLTGQERDALRQLVTKKVTEGFAASPFSRLVFKFQPPNPTQGLTNGLKLSVVIQDQIGIEDKYNRWVKSRSGPLFGTHPDAKLMAVVANLGEPSLVPVLDVGAGTGRNTLPLARRGHSVHGVELTPVFANQLQQAAKEQNLPVQVTQGNVLNGQLYLPPAHYKLGLVSEVIPHLRDLSQVRAMFERMCHTVQPGGWVLFNIFLAVDGYQPDAKAREMAQVSWSYFLTRFELQSVLQGLPLEILSDESAYEYERAHLPPEAWPPTNWFVSWSTGRNIFPIDQKPPVELRWMLAKRK